MLNDSGPGSLPVGVVHRSVTLEIGQIQHLRLKTDGAVLQRTQPIAEESIDRTGVDHLLRQRIQVFPVSQIVRIQPNLDSFQHIGDHFGIAAHGDSLIEGIEIVVVEGQPHRQPLDNEGRQILAIPPPLLFGVALDKLLVNIRAHQGNSLLLQVLRLSDACGSPLLPDLCGSLLRRHHAPHPVEGVHIKRQTVQLSLVIGHRGIGKTVKLRKAVYIIPYQLVVGVENMGAVNMDVDSLHRLGIHIAGDVRPLVDDQHRFACITALPGEHRAKQSRAYHQVIIFHRVITPLFIIAQIHPRVKGISQKLQPIFSLF